jgi:hypothetical protein
LAKIELEAAVHSSQGERLLGDDRCGFSARNYLDRMVFQALARLFEEGEVAGLHIRQQHARIPL